MKESGIWEKFFSVKISPLKTHKIVSICGLKLKFRCDGNRKALEKLRATIRENSVLIVETNTCHYEVIPGYAKYFSELGYNVDVAVYDGGQLDFLCEAVPTVGVHARRKGHGQAARRRSHPRLSLYFVQFRHQICRRGGGQFSENAACDQLLP